MLNILFLGQNPSLVSPFGAFVGTKSMKTLQSWMDSSGIDSSTNHVHFTNVFFQPGTRRFSKEDIRYACYDPTFYAKTKNMDIIVACGEVAKDAMKMAKTLYDYQDTDIVYVPHPSGLNRKLNNPDVVSAVIESLREAYASKNDQILQRLQKTRITTNSRLFDNVLQGKPDIVCPVVEIARERYK